MVDLDKTITVIDNEGKEHLMEVLFTYDNEERKTSYVFFFDKEAEDEIYVMRYTDKKELIEIEDPDEYAEVEEVFNAYQEDPKIQEMKK
ncbi:MAG: DUF1292 domain-containing protein [Bacilli bacterium]|nr:DUF1292 domain-containing protein [Bacilli bacterium]